MATKSGRIAMAFAAIYLIWGSTFLATRIAVTTLPPFFVAGFRYFVAGVVLFCVGRIFHPEPLRASHWRWAAALGALFFFICHGAVSWSVQHVPSGMAALLMASIALWTAVLEWILGTKNRPGASMLLSLLLGFSALAVLLWRPETLHAGGPAVIASSAILAGALSWAIGTVLSARAERPGSILTAAGMQMLCGGGMLIIASILLGKLPTPGALNPAVLGAMFYLTLVGSLVGFLCYAWLLTQCPPAVVATYAYVNPVVAILLGWAIAGETLSSRSLVASFVVVLAVAHMIWLRGVIQSNHHPGAARLATEEGA